MSTIALICVPCSDRLGMTGRVVQSDSDVMARCRECEAETSSWRVMFKSRYDAPTPAGPPA